MRRFIISLALAIIFAGVEGQQAMAKAKTKTKVIAIPPHWCSIRVKGYEVRSDIFFASVIPKKSITIGIVPRSPVTDVRWHVSGGKLSPGTYERSFLAPAKPGLYPIEVKARSGGRTVTARIKILVMVPASKVRDGVLEGYDIGVYPAYKGKHPEIYQPPSGYIRLTKENKDEPISENYRLGDFVYSYPDKYPKFLFINEPLVLKLELVTHEFKRLGMLKGRLHFLSAYRSPSHNRGGGKAKFSRHMYGSALDMFIDERGKPGVMDDLNRDGRVDIRDAIMMYKVIDAMSQRGLFKGIEGGLGVYSGSHDHGPFVHMDVRPGEGSIHWARDSSGHHIKNVAGWLEEPENKVKMPYGIPKLAVEPEESRKAAETADIKSRINTLQEKVDELEEKAKGLDAGIRPLGKEDVYIAADASSESLLLNRGRTILRRVNIECGDPASSMPAGLGGVFAVPIGIFDVRGQKLEPVWFQPSWSLFGNDLQGSYSDVRSAFYSGTNLEAGIDLGGGARIHCTAKKCNLAMPGCISMPPEDLRSVSSQIRPGTRVYIYESDQSATKKTDSKQQNDLVSLFSFLKMREKISRLDSKYLVIDLQKSRGFLKQGEDVIQNFPIKRIGPNFSKPYKNAAKKFNMPRGVFTVQEKRSNPPWYKPNWMYEDQDKKLPTIMAGSRIQTELLGKYGIYLGAGIVIHGVHDSKVPDKSIDYIAIELKPKDLAKVWQAVPKGGVVIFK